MNSSGKYTNRTQERSASKAVILSQPAPMHDTIMNQSHRFVTYILISLTGGSAYCILEYLYRGRTHWSMLVAGSICVALLYFIASESNAAIWKKWIIAGAVITTVEFVTGGIVNILLGWKVWDYTTEQFQFMGQICLAFSLVWIMISIPVIGILTAVHKQLILIGGGSHDRTDSY